MAFMDLPNEILEQTIIYALLEGFEGLALTCKLLHALCTPFIAHHNKLRFHFRNFEYCKTDRVAKSRIHAFTFPYTMGSAYNLIEQIAVEPTVASYIQDANFELDSHITQRLAREFATDESRDGDVIKLLANSSYLREAGLDWKQYHTVIEEDLNAARYSQHAAAFVLTLLPNLKTLWLPTNWGPVDTTDRLIDTVVHRARQAHVPHKRPPSMAQVTRFESSFFRRSNRRFDLDWVTPFLALPHVQSFCGPEHVDGHGNIASKYLHGGFGIALETVHLEGASVNEIAIAAFLKHTPYLKTLQYLHRTKINVDTQDWDICRFVTAIACEVGSHLTELSISIDELRGSIIPGKPSMHDFQQLQKLELPLEIAMCVLTASASADHELDLDCSESLLECKIANSNELFHVVQVQCRVQHTP